LLIVAVNPNRAIEDGAIEDGATEARFPEATQIFHCTFDPSGDVNYDDWPDRWTRRRGPGFPRYVAIKISEELSPVGGRCLRIDLDGGSAVAYSPAIPANALHGYVLEGRLRTEGLEHNRAFFSVTLLDKDRQRLETVYSKKVQTAGQWQKLRLGPIMPRDDETRMAVIGLHLEGGLRTDLNGAAVFTDIWLGRLPRLSLSANSPHHVYFDPSRIEITSRASGFTQKDPTLVFLLEDVFGHEIARSERPMTDRAVLGSPELSLDGLSDEPVGQLGVGRWKPPIPGPGFYRVRVAIKGATSALRRQALTLAVIEPCRGPTGGEFGWSLPRGDEPLPLPVLRQLLCQAGIHWIKYPLWYDEKTDDAKVEDLIALIERLNARGIDLVGMLNRPPEPVRAQFGDGKPPEAADIFTAPSAQWYPSLAPVLARLGGWVRWWQLGGDTDTSFVDCARLDEKIARVKTEMDRLGQDVKLGVGWEWKSQLPHSARQTSPCQFLALSAGPPLTPQELSDYLSAAQTARKPRPECWVTLKPLPRGQYSTTARVIDLVQRMMAAKIHGADAIFAADPFSTEDGLLNDDGTPGELLLPWRTTALLLGGSDYVGSIQMPGGSHNHIFAREDDAVMVVWNDKPIEEVIHLGDKVRRIDLWGRRTTPSESDHRQVLHVGPVPTFVVGLNESIARWRMAFSFAQDHMPSIFNKRHKNSYTIENSFPDGAKVRVGLVMPDAWEISPDEVTLQLAEEERWTQPFEILLPCDAGSGRYPVRIDFEVQARQLHRFSAYRHMDVGLGDVLIHVTTQLNDRGELEVRQKLTNTTSAHVNFACALDVPGRRRQNTQVLGLARGNNVKVYRLDNGKELIGKTLWLRAEEMDGSRVLNYRLVASE
jgi:hypothetical protein